MGMVYSGHGILVTPVHHPIVSLIFCTIEDYKNISMLCQVFFGKRPHLAVSFALNKEEQPVLEQRTHPRCAVLN